MLERLDETIVAISSAPGRAAVGIVRLSGPRAYEYLESIAQFPEGIELPARTRGEIIIDGAAFPAVFYLFRAPRSYTRQDLVEIHTIGAPPILQMVCDKLIWAGAIAAQPGEFTARAYFNGAMDLAAAEGVAQLIRAQSDTQLRAARRMMDGAWSVRLSALRDALGELLALVEAGIDFAEEPIEFISPKELNRRLSELIEGFEDVELSSADREVFNPAPRILLLGPPNAGKSSLMNRLSGISRAICAAVAGTTRDVLSAPVRLGSHEAILLDAAGIDESTDEIIRSAREIAMSTATTSDLVCVVFDAQTINREELRSFLAMLGSRDVRRFLIALNKCDLLSASEQKRLKGWLVDESKMPVIPVSALRGDGIEDLKSALSEALQSGQTTVSSEIAAFSERQRCCLAAALASMSRAATLAQNTESTSHCADLLAFELREALDAIGGVTGEVTTEHLLTQIFSNFCIGK